jgi:DNA polymerase sigma
MSKREEPTARRTMFEFQEHQINSLRKQNREFYDLIIDLKQTNIELKKIVIDLLDNNCKKSFKDAARKFVIDAD